MKLLLHTSLLLIWNPSFGQIDTISNSIVDGVHIHQHQPVKFANYLESPQIVFWNKVDTSYYFNGKIETITEIDSLYQRVGEYKEFDTTGILRVEGHFSQIDTAECMNCYKNTLGFGSPGKWFQITKIDVREIKVGQWFTYHSNGKMATSGQYDTLFTIHYGQGKPQGINRISAIYMSELQLKAGIWRYYDITGKLYLQEEYFRGQLVFKIEYE